MIYFPDYNLLDKIGLSVCVYKKAREKCKILFP